MIAVPGAVVVEAPQPVAVQVHAGLATRTLAFAIDAAIVNGVAAIVGAVLALGLSLLAVPHDVRVVLAAIGAAAAVVWAVAYFTFFWSADGRTPGNGVMRIRVQDGRTGEAVSVRRAFVRVLLLPLSALPLCAGFLLILFDGRRRALHDRLARTVVVYAPAATRAPRA